MVSFAVFLRFTFSQVGALIRRVFPSALAFLARQFSLFFDDIPFSVARDANHFSLPALHFSESNRH
jgi:hypothetical protein